MRNAAEFPAPPRSSRRAPVAAVLIAVLLSMTACAQSRGKTLLTDAQLDGINAGINLCGLFGVSGPCIGSRLEVYEPTLPADSRCSIHPQTSKNCFSSPLALPLPQSGTITIQQSFIVDGLGKFQSVSQSNSVNIQQPLVRSTCFICLNSLDVWRFPGH